MADSSYASWNRVNNRMRRKVKLIFQEAFGERGEGMCNWRSVFAFQNTLVRAFVKDLGKNKAGELAVYMADWGEECAIMAAIQLFPERFTARELRQAVEWVLMKIPYDTGWAAELLGYSVAEYLHDGYKAKSLPKQKKTVRKKAKRGQIQG